MAWTQHKKLNDFGKSPPWRHITFLFTMLRSTAYRSLDPKARALIVEFAMRYNGQNNGQISYSVREVAEALGVAPNTAMKALKDLIDRGFIVPVQKGSFTWKQRKATTWRLTWLPTGHKGNRTRETREFMKWTPPK